MCETESNDDLTSFQRQETEDEQLSQRTQSQLSLDENDEPDCNILDKSFCEIIENDTSEPVTTKSEPEDLSPKPVSKKKPDLVRQRVESIIAASRIDKSIQRPLSAFTVIGDSKSPKEEGSSSVSVREKAPQTSKRQKTDQKICDQEPKSKSDNCKVCRGTVEW